MRCLREVYPERMLSPSWALCGYREDHFLPSVHHRRIESERKGSSLVWKRTKSPYFQNAAGFGWDLKPYVDQKKLTIVKLEPTDAKSTVTRVKSELPEYIKAFGASRIVLDSVSLLNMLYDSEREKRLNLFDLIQMIRKTGATCLMTAEVKDDNPNTSRDGLVEYAVDGVIALRYER